MRPTPRASVLLALLTVQLAVLLWPRALQFGSSEDALMHSKLQPSGSELLLPERAMRLVPEPSPPPPLTCAVESASGYLDALGYDCSSWFGFNCNSNQYYTAAQLADSLLHLKRRRTPHHPQYRRSPHLHL
ncbi:hypothetical protein AB1Y20_023361 [Prymnesium parvum]|uniref:Uncharacterized protein n=1 Tax=Prymnesium parvum TaxID=97485 RepID=A0AB34JEE9_PRYPA